MAGTDPRVEHDGDDDDKPSGRRGWPRLRFPRRPSTSSTEAPVEIRPPDVLGGDPEEAEAVAEQIRTPGGLAAGLSEIGRASCRERV